MESVTHSPSPSNVDFLIPDAFLTLIRHLLKENERKPFFFSLQDIMRL
jgi:hypothetical protein